MPIDEEIEWALIDGFSKSSGYDVADIGGLDDLMLLGDYCSSDNTESAVFNGRDVHSAGGWMVLRDGEGDPGLLTRCLAAAGFEPERYHGSFTVICFQ